MHIGNPWDSMREATFTCGDERFISFWTYQQASWKTAEGWLEKRIRKARLAAEAAGPPCRQRMYISARKKEERGAVQGRKISSRFRQQQQPPTTNMSLPTEESQCGWQRTGHLMPTTPA